MIKYRDNSGAIRFAPTKEDNEKYRLLNKISDLERHIKNLEKRISKLERNADVNSEVMQ